VRHRNDVMQSCHHFFELRTASVCRLVVLNLAYVFAVDEGRLVVRFVR
jgi:hypothetical protein